MFLSSKGRGTHIVVWTPLKKKASRTVAKPCMQDGQEAFWRHQGAYLKMLFLANRFYLKITPTWVLTEDGNLVKAGPKIGKTVNKWTGPERNLQVLYHVRFWTTTLRTSRGPISIRAGDQWIEVGTVPAFIQLPYGIAHDHKDLLRLLDQEAPLLAAREEELADLGAQTELVQATVRDDEDEDDQFGGDEDEEDLDVE